MIGFLKSVWDSLTGVIEFVIHGIGSLLWLLTQIPTYIAALIQLIAQIPTVYQGILIATITITVIFLITGRGK